MPWEDFAILEETDVADCELDRSCRANYSSVFASCSWSGVFTDSQEVVECDTGEVRDGLELWRCGFVCCLVESFNDRDR